MLVGDLLPKKAQNREIIQREFINGYFKEYFNLLNENDIKFIGILGNDDVEAIEDDYYKMISSYKNVFDIDNKIVTLENINFIGLNKVLDTPFFRKDHIAVEDGQVMPKQLHNEILVHKGRDFVSLEEWARMRDTEVEHMENILENLPKPKNEFKTIYVMHGPPYGIGLDFCKDGAKPGSKAMTEFLENSNAYMSLHGHIHESPEFSLVWNNKLGNTICIQPGQTEFGSLKLNYVLIDTDNNIYERFIK